MSDAQPLDLKDLERDLDQLTSLRSRIDGSGIASDGPEAFVLLELVRVLEEAWTLCGVHMLERDPPESTPVLDLMQVFKIPTHLHALASIKSDGARSDVRQAIRREVRLTAEELEKAVRSTVGEYSDQVVARDHNGRPLDYDDRATVWWRTCRDLQAHASQLDRMEHAAETAHEFEKKIEEASATLTATTAAIDEQVQRAKNAANEVASQSLSTHFNELAKAELKAARWYRGVAVGAGLAAVIASMLLHLAGDADQLKDIPMYAPVLALTFLAVYLARLAGPHFNLGKWAKSVEVQLESFKGFTGVVEDGAVRERMREEFGRRVLGAPPLFDASAEPSPGLSTTDVLQILAAVRGQSSKS